jgi:flagellar protein FliO/FliZ
MSTQLTFFFAFVVVLALIGAAAWLVRRFAGNRLGSNANRGRMPRLAVIDAAAVDGRRRLVLVRRDNVEHLLMIGGPSDIVVEQNIVRAMPAREQAPPRPNVGTELPPRVALPDAGNWSDSDAASDHPEPALPELPLRPARPSFADEVRRPAPALSERRGNDLLSGLAPPESSIRPEPRLEPRSEPMPSRPLRSEPLIPRPSRPIEPPKAPPIRAPERAAAPPAPPPAPPPPAPAQSPPLSAADQNLAEMAQRLEAALRRPAGDSAEPRVGAPPVAPEPPPSRPRAESMAPPVAPPAPKTGFENLEDEMASLLGRPKNLS